VDEQAPSISIRDLLLIVLRRWRLIASVAATVTVAGTVHVFLIVPQYRAAAKILFTTDRAQISTSSERPTELLRTSQVSEGELNSQVQILRSRDLVEAVLTSMGVKPMPASAEGEGPGLVSRVLGFPKQLLRAPYRRLHRLDEMEMAGGLYWETRAVLGRIDASRIPNSNLIEIGFTGTEPTWARDFVNRLTTAYVERHAELQQITEAEDFFTTQSRILQRKLAESEASLRELREQAGAISGQQAEVHERLNEFNAELARTKIARAEQDVRVQYLERMQASAGQGGKVATPELLALEARRAELIGRYRPDSERVRDIDEQIRRLRGAIAAYDGISSSAESGGTDLIGARAQLAALKGKEAALARERDEYRKQAELLDAQSFDLVRLERQVKIDEEAYLSYVRTAEQSRLSNALEKSKLLRLTIVEPASLPVEPVSPQKGRMISFVVLGGLVVGLAVGFVRDHFDTTIKTPADVRRYGNLDVLAVVPDRV
jgi:uncharacterized protein involved in exopolysaccharide biosynthesis